MFHFKIYVYDSRNPDGNEQAGEYARSLSKFKYSKVKSFWPNFEG